MTVFAQFRIVFNANPNKRLKGGWVQSSIDGGFDIPFKYNYFKNYYGYKMTKVKKGLGIIEDVSVYDEVPRKTNSDDVVLIHRQWTFCFFRVDWNTVTKQGALKNREMEEYWKNEEVKWKHEEIHNLRNTELKKT